MARSHDSSAIGRVGRRHGRKPPLPTKGSSSGRNVPEEYEGRPGGGGRLGSFHWVRLTLFSVRDTVVSAIDRPPESASSSPCVRPALPSGMRGAGSVNPSARQGLRKPSASTRKLAGHDHPSPGSRRREGRWVPRSPRSISPSEMRTQSRCASRNICIAVTPLAAPHRPAGCSSQ